MKKYALITTYYCNGCPLPQKEYLKDKFNFDGDVENIYINFSNEFDPFNLQNIPNIGATRRKDLVFAKIFLLRKFIEENILNRYEYLLHIDFSDTKFSRSCNKMVDVFVESGEDIVISTEKNCWPYIEIVNTWLDTPLEDKEFFYLNSGGVISKTKKFYDLLVQLEDICLNTNIDFWDDQGVWQYYHLKINNIKTDPICQYFFSTAMLDDSYYTIENKKIKTKFNTEPYLIHDNSSFSLNLINKI